MAFKLAVVSVLCLMAVGAMTRENIDCYAMDNHPYLMFGSKTAYDLVYQRPKQHDNEIRDCQPVQLWMMARHGTRYPGRSTIRAMQQLENLSHTVVQNHEERRNGRLCYADLERLKGWVLNVSMAEAKLLTAQGKADMYYLAKRFRSRFPQLFNQSYSERRFIFRHTDTERTRESAVEFSGGMFGRALGIWLPTPVANDSIIKPYENCTYWRHHVRSDPVNMREIELFRNGLDMNNVVHNVSQRLGFLYDLAADTVLLMYDMCRYDKAWNLHGRSPWCAAFSREELLVLEYFDDLKSFYESGYGNELNLRLGCTPIKDMLEKFQMLEAENLDIDQTLGVFYFTHSDMIAMTVARMGLASHGKQLRHDNFPDQRQREWATSKITPFAANLAAVFFKCSTGERNRVMFFLNEKVQDLEHLECNLGLCSWTDVKERFKDIPFECNLRWCSGASVTKVSTLFIAALFVVNFFRNL